MSVDPLERAIRIIDLALERQEFSGDPCNCEQALYYIEVLSKVRELVLSQQNVYR